MIFVLGPKLMVFWVSANLVNLVTNSPIKLTIKYLEYVTFSL